MLLAKTNIVELFNQEDPLKLESGQSLNRVQVAYQTYGKLNSDATNVVLVCHALTGNAHAAGILKENEVDPESKPDLLNKYSKLYKDKAGWWDNLIGPGKAIDTNRYFVVCPNILGSCYGTTGPCSINPETKESYKMKFPVVSVRDMVRVQKSLMDKLGINRIEFIIGGSLGGMQTLEWAVMYPEFMKGIVPIGAAAKHSAWSIGLNELARNAIMNDPVWNKGVYKQQPANGLALARKTAMMSYRTQQSFEKRFGRERVKKGNYFKANNLFQVQSYLNYQGKKLTERFDANSYIHLTHSMDLHDLSYKRDQLGNVMDSVKCRGLVIGINSDILYPAIEQREIAILLRNSHYAEIVSPHGHDAFLIEFEQLGRYLADFIERLDA